MPLQTPSDGLDLLAMREAGAAIDAAAARLRAEAVRGRLFPVLAGLPAPLRAALDALIDEIGRASAEAEAARQAAQETRRERGDWLQIDPLRHIPEDRGEAPPPPPASFEVNAGDPNFVGYGWHSAEYGGAESWRWSGLTPAVSVVIPDLGPGTVALELRLELPFGARFDPEAITILANGEPLEITAARVENSLGTLSAIWEGSGAPGTNLGLVLIGPLLEDPRGRDSRKLGLGIRRVSARRVALTG